jgi:protein TonB
MVPASEIERFVIRDSRRTPVVFAADHSRRLCTFAFITALHAAVIYAVLSFAPQLREAVVAQAPLHVTFVSQSEPLPQRPLPQATVVPTQPSMLLPELPAIDIPDDLPPPARAITVPPLVATPPPAVQAEDRSTPRLVSTVEYVREPAPRYPPQSRRLREQGLVVLRVIIDERGTASSIEIETSSGHARLDDAAREAVLRAEFRPYIEDGEPRPALVLIPIEFALNRTPA